VWEEMVGVSDEGLKRNWPENETSLVYFMDVNESLKGSGETERALSDEGGYNGRSACGLQGRV